MLIDDRGLYDRVRIGTPTGSLFSISGLEPDCLENFGGFGPTLGCDGPAKRCLCLFYNVRGFDPYFLDGYMHGDSGFYRFSRTHLVVSLF